MNATIWLAGSLAAALLLGAGCGQSKQAGQDAAARPVAVDLPKLRDTCASGNPEVRAAANRAIIAIRSDKYAAALAELDKLAANPNLTEPQKQAVSEVREQVKHNLARTLPLPSQ